MKQKPALTAVPSSHPASSIVPSNKQRSVLRRLGGLPKAEQEATALAFGLHMVPANTQPRLQ